MKKLITVCQALVIAAVISTLALGETAWAVLGNTIQPGVTVTQTVSVDNTVLPSYLRRINAPTNGYCLKYDSATGSFEWASCGAGGGTTTLPWDNITSRPTINGVTVTGTVLDNVLNYPAAIARLASPTFTGTVTIPTPFTLGAVSVTPTGTELNYMDGVTSGVQTQINSKQDSSSMLTNLSSKTVQDNVTVYDDRKIRFGTDNDFTVRYKSADATLVIALDNGDAMCTFSKTGNLTCTGEINASQYGSTGTDNTFGINLMNTADPTGMNLEGGLQWMTDNCFRVRSTDNTVTYSAGCLIKTFSFGIDNVIVSDDEIYPWQDLPRAITIARVSCIVTTDNVVGNLSECTAADISSCTPIDSTDWTVGGATKQTTSTIFNSGFENASIAAGAHLRWMTTSVGTTNSNKLSCTVQYRE